MSSPQPRRWRVHPTSPAPDTPVTVWELGDRSAEGVPRAANAECALRREADIIGVPATAVSQLEDLTGASGDQVDRGLQGFVLVEAVLGHHVRQHTRIDPA